MINRPKDWDSVKGYGDFQMLPKGGYPLVVKNAAVEKYTWGDCIKLSCDISEGEYADWFMTDWKNQQSEDKKWRCNFLISIPKDDGTERDGWAKRKMRTIMNAFEESNDGYRWDWNEVSLKGKKIIGLFNIRQYQGSDGKVHDSTSLKNLISVKQFESGKYRFPDEDLIYQPSNPAFAPVDEVKVNQDLPW